MYKACVRDAVWAARWRGAVRCCALLIVSARSVIVVIQRREEGGGSLRRAGRLAAAAFRVLLAARLTDSPWGIPVAAAAAAVRARFDCG